MNVSDHGLAGWAASGAMALTGRASGPPLVAPGDVTGRLQDDLDVVAEQARARLGTTVDLPDVGILGERAAMGDLRRDGPRSCGGAFRTIRATDGWFGLSLARPDDVGLVPALTDGRTDDPWEAVARWSADVSRAEASERATLLSLPHATWPPLPLEDRTAVELSPGGRRERRRERPLVVDMSALWAGPLCAHLLGLAGCDVVKVEDVGRPDGARHGPAEFFDLLHGGHDGVSTDLVRHGATRLLELLHRADLVIESARPRALRQLGIRAEDLVSAGVIWVSVTARGRGSDAVGFGDDVAVAGGLAIDDGEAVLPVGDAIADPLTGARAAAAASMALAEPVASLVDVSMIHVARSCADGPTQEHHVVRHGAGWQLRGTTGSWLVQSPRARAPRRPAPRIGQHDARWWS